MKRNLLLKELQKRGAVFVRHGRKHDIYGNLKKPWLGFLRFLEENR